MLASLGIDFRLILVLVIGFLILVFVLSRFAFGPLLNLLEERQSTIRGNLDEAEARREEMTRLQRDYEGRLAKIEDEARDKIQSAIREAQSARDEILTRAHADSQAVVERGRLEIEQERAKAMEGMRNQIADLAVQAASRIVKQNLSGGNHAALIDDVINGLGSTNGHAAGSTL